MAREKTERLLNLLIALSSASRPVSREEIRSWLLDLYGSDQSADAFEKMFERDKDELRTMGIPIETVTNAHNEVVGYTIDRSVLRLTDIKFTTAELAVLNTAAALWSSASASSPARSAILKLEATSGVTLNESSIVTALNPSLPEGSLRPLLDAIKNRVLVHFQYQRAGQPLSKRSVAPWGVVTREGHWYLVGFDTDRGAIRTFRLSRIRGDIKTGDSTDITAPADVDLVTLIETQNPRFAATVRVTPHRALGLRRAHDVTHDVTEFVVRYDDPAVMTADIARYAPHVIVLEPEDLREAVIRHLQSIVEVPHE